MSETVTPSRLARMGPRDPHEPGRTGSTLELFFDLVFVVAVSNASMQLHHAFSAGHLGDGLFSYAVVFFGIWWAWMNFTWFATSFAADDWLYRCLTFVQMAGVLILAAGIEPTFTNHDYHVLVYGYVVMRIAMVAQWLRASRAGGSTRDTTRTYAAGIAAIQVLWLAWLAVPAPLATPLVVLLIGGELAVPVLAERRGTTPWHPHHITERYGLFTLIVLGESLLASANATITAMHQSEALGPLIMLSALVLLITAGLWWVYFWPAHHRCIGGLRRSLRYGYTHYLVFAAAAAVSVGIEVQIDLLAGESSLSSVVAGYAVALPVAVFLLGIWWIALRDQADRWVNGVLLVGVLVIAVNPLLAASVPLTAAVLIVIVGVLVWRPRRDVGDEG